MLGLGLTVRGIVMSFGGAGASAGKMKSVVFQGASEALVSCVYGLALSIFTLTLRHILETQLRTFEAEMRHRPAEFFAFLSR